MIKCAIASMYGGWWIYHILDEGIWAMFRERSLTRCWRTCLFCATHWLALMLRVRLCVEYIFENAMLPDVHRCACSLSLSDCVLVMAAVMGEIKGFRVACGPAIIAHWQKVYYSHDENDKDNIDDRAHAYEIMQCDWTLCTYVSKSTQTVNVQSNKLQDSACNYTFCKGNIEYHVFVNVSI